MTDEQVLSNLAGFVPVCSFCGGTSQAMMSSTQFGCVCSVCGVIGEIFDAQRIVSDSVLSSAGIVIITPPPLEEM